MTISAEVTDFDIAMDCKYICRICNNQIAQKKTTYSVFRILSVMSESRIRYHTMFPFPHGLCTLR